MLANIMIKHIELSMFGFHILDEFLTMNIRLVSFKENFRENLLDVNAYSSHNVVISSTCKFGFMGKHIVHINNNITISCVLVRCGLDFGRSSALRPSVM